MSRDPQRVVMLNRLLESIAGRSLTTLEKMDVRALVLGGPGVSGARLCQCEQTTADACRKAGNC